MNRRATVRYLIATTTAALTLSVLTAPAANAAECNFLQQLFGQCTPEPAEPAEPAPCNFLQQLFGQCTPEPAEPTEPTPTEPTPTPGIEGCDPLPKPDGSTWTCTFADNFNGNTLNTNNWTPILTSETGLSGGQDCWINHPDNINISNGTLKLTTRELPQPMTCQNTKGKTFQAKYTSGSISTVNKFTQTYGRWEIRAKLPQTKILGQHSAIWMWRQDQGGGNINNIAEIDIAEYYTYYPDRAIPYLHYNAANGDPVTNNYCMIENPDQYHTYIVEFDEQGITIKYDNNICLQHNWKPNFPQQAPSPFDTPFFMTLTQALGVGGNKFTPGTSEIPATMTVDYVKAWK